MIKNHNYITDIKLLIKKRLTHYCQRVFLHKAIDVTAGLPGGSLLVIAPHPDDETLGCAGTMALYKALGRPVRIIVVTDGAQAVLPTPLSPHEIAATRRKETLKAASQLGIGPEDIAFLGHPDGEAASRIDRIAEDIASQLWLYNPAMILSPSGMDAHTDHRAVAAAVQKLHKEGKISCQRMDYPMWFWPKGGLNHLISPRLMATHRKVDVRSYLNLKQEAIAAHACQKHEQNWELLEAYGIAANLNDYELFFEPMGEK